MQKILRILLLRPENIQPKVLVFRKSHGIFSGGGFQLTNFLHAGRAAALADPSVRQCRRLAERRALHAPENDQSRTTSWWPRGHY
jgi:hypothetical protein